MTPLSALHDMTLFVAVARTGNFSRASAQLQVPAATLSRRIAAMEKSLGVRLFDRTTRRVGLTDTGRRYFERCAHLVDEACLAQEALRDCAMMPSGHVRVSMPVDLGVLFIGPWLPDFARQYPGISLDLDLSPRNADLVNEQLDLAIRLGPVNDDRVIARRLGQVEMALFASPAYLHLRGRPDSPADLVQHEAVFVRNPRRQALWSLQREGESVQVSVGGRFMANNIGLIQLLAERGLGIAPVARVLLSEAVAQQRLVPVLPQWSLPPMPIHALVASRLQPAAVKAFIDFVAGRLANLSLR